MPFKSKQQMKACFATDGFGGKVDCREWARETKNKKSLPNKKEQGGYNMYRPKNCKKCGGRMKQTGGIQTYTQANTPQGAITPTGQSNLATLSPEQIRALAGRFGFRTDTNANLQQDLFNYAQQNQPQAYQAMVQKYGPTASGNFVDNMLGARTSELLQSLPAPQAQQPQPQPYRVTSTFSEHMYGPGQRALGAASNRYRDSYDITDAGMVDTGNPREFVNFQFYKPNSTELDTARGTYRIPNDVYMNQIARGTNTIANPALLDPYRIPDNAMVIPSNTTVSTVRQQGGQANPSAGLTHGPTYTGVNPTHTDSSQYRRDYQGALLNPILYQQYREGSLHKAFDAVSQGNRADVDKWRQIYGMYTNVLSDAERDLQNFGPNAGAAPIVLYQPKDTVRKPRMKGGRLVFQIGGSAPKQQDYPDYESWQVAMDEWSAGQQGTPTSVPPIPPVQMNAFDNIQGIQSFQPTGDFTSAATWDPMMQQNAPTYAQAQRNPPRQNSNNPYATLQRVGLGLMAARTGLGEIAGRIERGRQNQYDYQQQTALGMMNPMQSDDFQPNPYNLYMQKGGNLKTILRDYNKYTNNAQFDFGSGDNDKGMMKKGGYEIDRMLIVRKLLPELLKLGRLGSGKYRNYKKGGAAHGGNPLMAQYHNLSPEQYQQMLLLMQGNPILPVDPNNPMEGFHTMPDGSMMSNSDPSMEGYRQGGIHIKKENRGKFTEYCGGKVTDECIQRGKNSPSATTRKRATFAANARKWN